MSPGRPWHAALVAALLQLGLYAPSAPAHHFFAPEYERETRGTIEGVVTAVAFENPHVAVAVRVVDDNGTEAIWFANTVSPSSVRERGWFPDTIRIGDRVAVEGFLGRSGALRIWIQSIVLPGGRTLYPVGRELPASGD